MSNFEEEKRKPGKKKPGQWSLMDLLMAFFGLIVLGVLTVAGFKFAKWALARIMEWF